MRRQYVLAIGVFALALGAVSWSWFDTGDMSWPALIVMSAGAPTAAMLFAAERLRRPVNVAALIGGGTIGVGLALLSHGVVFGLAAIFFSDFADRATDLLDRLDVDPAWTSALGSPWTLLVLIEVALVAPLTEEFGKGLGARLARPSDRRSAFLAGVAAGTGFAIVENVFYALTSSFFGDPWEAIVVARMLGFAVHPLASGLVMLGWWEWRQRGDGGALVRRFAAGAGVHAIWNGSLVVLGVTATVYESGVRYATMTQVSLAYTAALGIGAAGLLWRLTAAVAAEQRSLAPPDVRDGRTVTAWVVLASTFLIPMAILLIAFPSFSIGG